MKLSKGSNKMILFVLLFRFLDGLTFGVLLWFLIFWFIGFFKKYSKK
jgi:hypothetical protein